MDPNNVAEPEEEPESAKSVPPPSNQPVDMPILSFSPNKSPDPTLIDLSSSEASLYVFYWLNWRKLRIQSTKEEEEHTDIDKTVENLEKVQTYVILVMND